MEEADEEGEEEEEENMLSVQATESDDDALSLRNSRVGTNANIDLGHETVTVLHRRQSHGDYARGEHLHGATATIVPEAGPFSTIALSAHPDYDSLDADGAPSYIQSLHYRGPDLPYTSRVRTASDSSGSNSPVEENSPKGSPGSKYEEFVPNSPFQPSMPRFQDRRYTLEDVNPYTVHGRLASFYVHHWNVPFMNIRVLAKVGFYYEGNGDEVICVRCGGSLKGWQRGDDPWVEHRNNFNEDCFRIN